MHEDLTAALANYKKAFHIDIEQAEIERLADYYALVQHFTPRLHLVAPCSPQEFATRHILESLTLLEHLPLNARFADVGTGAGLPSIPCLIVRPDLHALLIESKEKKAGFLATVIGELGLKDRASVVNRQFEETDPVDVKYVACRALDKFIDKLPRLLKWSGRRTLLFFGGPSLGESLTKLGLKYEKRLMPLSAQRYLFVISGA